MVIRRKAKRTEQSKLDATPPWEPKRIVENPKTDGPYDVADAPEDGVERVDLGALLVPLDSGLEVRLEVAEGGQITTVSLVDESGQMQLGLFAAPRTEGIWDEVRTEIKASISQQGGTVQDADGEFGLELTGKLPGQGGLTPVRFVGVDGPRWFLRAMLVGTPAADDNAANRFLGAFRKTVVVRGNEALPVRDAVTLTLPKQVASELEQAQESDGADGLDPETGP